MNLLMNDEAVYRTAPAALGLLITFGKYFIYFVKTMALLCSKLVNRGATITKLRDLDGCGCLQCLICILDSP